MKKSDTDNQKTTNSMNTDSMPDDYIIPKNDADMDEFIAKQQAFNALISYYNDYYTGAKILDKSFQKSFIKIDLENRTVTLTYDSSTKSIDEKDVAKKRRHADYEQITLFDLPKTPTISTPNKKHDSNKWSDGFTVINICNNKEYRVKKDEGNIVEVFDKDYGYLIMAKSDLILKG